MSLKPRGRLASELSASRRGPGGSRGEKGRRRERRRGCEGNEREGEERERTKRDTEMEREGGRERGDLKKVAAGADRHLEEDCRRVCDAHVGIRRRDTVVTLELHHPIPLRFPALRVPSRE